MSTRSNSRSLRRRRTMATTDSVREELHCGRVGTRERKRRASGGDCNTCDVRGNTAKRKKQDHIEIEEDHSSKNEQSLGSSISHQSHSHDILRTLDHNIPACDWLRGFGYQRLRSNPLPAIGWADRKEVWQAMIDKESGRVYERYTEMFDRHPTLHARMRSILLDWLSEVCEVYKLHRETLYLAAEFVDRYLSRQIDVQKSSLQLVGITALFIAAKMEEIYPPKLSEFSYVTDGACSDEEVLLLEIVMLQVLQWNLSPLTSITWLKVFLQARSDQARSDQNSAESSSISSYNNDYLSHSINDENSASRSSNCRRLVNGNKLKNCSKNSDGSTGAELLLPRYDRALFIRTARLLDLCMLDIGYVGFSHRHLALSALAHTTSPQEAAQAAGCCVGDFEVCYDWMNAFHTTLTNDMSSLAALTSSMMTAACDSCVDVESDPTTAVQLYAQDLIQRHTVNVEILESAQSISTAVVPHSQALITSHEAYSSSSCPVDSSHCTVTSTSSCERTPVNQYEEDCALNACEEFAYSPDGEMMTPPPTMRRRSSNVSGTPTVVLNVMQDCARLNLHDDMMGVARGGAMGGLETVIDTPENSQEIDDVKTEDNRTRSSRTVVDLARLGRV